jgi:hypothetical protein
VDANKASSATPRGDYSLGAHAASIRDLLAAEGSRYAEVVGEIADAEIATWPCRLPARRAACPAVWSTPGRLPEHVVGWSPAPCSEPA